MKNPSLGQYKQSYQNAVEYCMKRLLLPRPVALVIKEEEIIFPHQGWHDKEGDTEQELCELLGLDYGMLRSLRFL